MSHATSPGDLGVWDLDSSLPGGMANINHTMVTVEEEPGAQGKKSKMHCANAEKSKKRRGLESGSRDAEMQTLVKRTGLLHGRFPHTKEARDVD